ncbi:MAG: dsbB [Gammaproteobacteria bacterium]|jgi:disulfide bond formation protein DsbB|nr:dsbB [Gammaproteobacteria bacterium]
MSRLSYSLGFILCAFFCAFAFYLENDLGQLPCLLCEMQRIVVAAMGAIFLIAAIHNPARIGRNVYFFLLLILGLFGLLLAGRQLWLMAHPPADTYSQCSASLSYLVHTLPFDQVLKTALQGGADCAKATWSFLSLTLPAWGFIVFSVLLVLSGMTALGRTKAVGASWH